MAVLASLAGALISLGYLTEKLNPIIKPLMESIKKEPIFQLQKLSAEKLVAALDLCMVKKLPLPAGKVTRNLIHFAYVNEFSSIEDSEEVIRALKDDEVGNVIDSNVQIRGPREALKILVLHFKSEVTSKPPRFFERVVLPFQVGTYFKKLFFVKKNVLKNSIFRNLS